MADIAGTLPEGYVFIKADICDAEAVRKAFDTYAIDAVCNFAAESHVDRSIVAPDAFIKTNIEGTFPLMILNALENKVLPVFGDGCNIRDWLYVEDHCRAVWEIVKNGTRGQTYNIGGRCETV